MAIGDIYRLAFVSNTSAQNAMVVNRWAFRQKTAHIQPTPAEDLTLAAANLMLSEYLAILASPFSLETIEARGLTNPEEGHDRGLEGQVGALPGEVLPFQVAPVVTWTTGLVGRTNRGRTFLPPPNEASASSGIITTAYTNSVSSLAAAMITDMSTHILTSFGQWELGIWGAPLTDPPTAPTFKLVTGRIIRTLTGVQRRRRPGVGS